MKKKRIIFAAGAVALLFAVTSTKPVDSQNYPKITVKTKRVNNLNFPLTNVGSYLENSIV